MRILTSTKGMDIEEWRNLRRKSLGGSDASVIVGLNNWKSSYTLWADKKGYLPNTEDNEAMRIGSDLEEYVARRFTEATGKKVKRRNYMFLHDKYDFITANVDREIVGEKAGLECKTTNVFAKSDFENGEIPLYYYCQCMHYMAVMGYEKMYLAVLVLGKKDGALAAGLGAALSDLLTGAMIWVLPTFIFKFIMGYIMGVVLEKGNNEKLDWIVGASLGGLFQCFAYTLFKIPLFTAAVAFASVPRLLAQTIMGLVIYAIVANVLAKSKMLSLQGVVA